MVRWLRVFFVLIFCGACTTRVAREPTPSPPPTSPSLVYRFEGVELFGARTVPKAELLAPYLQRLPAEGTRLDMAKDGDAFIQTLAAAKEELLQRHPMAMVRNSVTAYSRDMTLRLTVDVVEPGDAWRLDFAPSPEGSVEDPAQLLPAWTAYHSRMWQLVNAGTISSEDTQGCRAFHCFYGPTHPELMKLEAPLLAGVPVHFQALAHMLHTDRRPSKREQAAYLLAYGPSREEVARELIPAMQDPDEAPRNAVLRVLWVLQEGADRPLLDVKLILRALHGPLISDRNKAAGLLAAYVKKDRAPRQQILREAGPVLLEMAGARQVIERQPALDVLRTLAGTDLGEDLSRWSAWVQENDG